MEVCSSSKSKIEPKKADEAVDEVISASFKKKMTLRKIARGNCGVVLIVIFHIVAIGFMYKLR